MKNPLYIDTTPPRFWSTLVRTDLKLHRAATGRTPSLLAVKTDHLTWGYPETTFEGTEGWHRNTAWQGRRWLGPLAIEGRLHIKHIMPETAVPPPAEELDTDEPSLSWLSPLVTKIDRSIRDGGGGGGSTSRDISQSADEIYAGYNFSPSKNNYTLFVRHLTHTSIYTLPHTLLKHERAAIYDGGFRSEPNPTPDDCQMILDEMRIGAGEMYGYPPLEQ